MSEIKQTPQRLDDEARVRVLSPTMLVLKRFMRNKLAITGLGILVVMFIFSFLGGLFSPYQQQQVFKKQDIMYKDYINVVRSEELRYTVAEGEAFPQGARAQLILAINTKRDTFASGQASYALTPIGDAYLVTQGETLGTALGVANTYNYKEAAGKTIPADVRAAFEAALAAKESTFTLEGVEYRAERAGKSYTLYATKPVAVASRRIWDAYSQADEPLAGSFSFRVAAESAAAAGAREITVDGTVYALEQEGEELIIYRVRDGAREPFAIASDMVATGAAPDVYISVPFKNAIIEAIASGARTFTFPDAGGEEITYQVNRGLTTWAIKRQTMTELIRLYEAPSAEHLLGTDGSGMDIMTRLMYGGQISLMVGFVVVFLELLIGIVIGGVAGYFGGWFDTLLMRFIDLFNCIPQYPVLIIIGSAMDQLNIVPVERIFYLMFILGIMGWTGVARVVRGQILTLREQDFMVATEALGIRASRRIFRHLVPNVMPLLIVQATMGLGEIIIAEATLSYLGLGLKYPMASWGTIINAATNIYVMTNYWFAWIPAGMLILLTVLGFNFVGDGLRDAFDPKMKR